METGIKVGHEINKADVKAVSDALVQIMKQSGDQKTIRCAIEALSKVFHIQNVNISNVNMVGDKHYE